VSIVVIECGWSVDGSKKIAYRWHCARCDRHGAWSVGPNALTEAERSAAAHNRLAHPAAQVAS